MRRERMRWARWGGLLLALLFLVGCGSLPGPGRLVTGEMRKQTIQAEEELDAQLGRLAHILRPEERAAVRALWTELWPIRANRLALGKYEKGVDELRLLRRLNALYDQYTIDYLGGDDQGWGYTYPELRTLGQYDIRSDGTIAPSWIGVQPEEDYSYLWDQMTALLGTAAFEEFTRFQIFSDGAGETMAYIYALDADGARWEIGVDPEDAADDAIFVETVLHEYAHYLTLNHRQVRYTRHQTVDTYNEPGLVSAKGSYLDDFVQRFWTGYLDDCLVSADTYNFSLRHYDDFVSGYASTDPSEDISECFAYFVLWDRWEDGGVWKEKLNFFYHYPELVALRTEIRGHLGLNVEDVEENAPASTDAGAVFVVFTLVTQTPGGSQ